MRSSSSPESGQVIVEALVAMSIIVGSLMGMLYLSRTAIGLHREIADQIVATNLAAEGIEIVKNMIDNSVLTCDVVGDGRIVNASLECRAWNEEFPRPTQTFGVSYTGARSDEFAAQFLVFDESVGRYDYSVLPQNVRPGSRRFRRSLTVKRESETQLHVTAVVSWASRADEEQKVELNTDFYDWRQK